MESDTIALRYKSCEAAFQHLSELAQLCDETTLLAVNTEKERLEIWANNIGAAQKPSLPSSLESRLHNDQDARTMVLKLLGHCKASLEEGAMDDTKNARS